MRYGDYLWHALLLSGLGNITIMIIDSRTDRRLHPTSSMQTHNVWCRLKISRKGVTFVFLTQHNCATANCVSLAASFCTQYRAAPYKQFVDVCIVLNMFIRERRRKKGIFWSCGCRAVAMAHWHIVRLPLQWQNTVECSGGTTHPE